MNTIKRTKRRLPKTPIELPALDAKAIGSRISEVRRKRGWRQLDLAIVASLAPGSVGAYESGHRIPRTVALVAIATALHRTMDFIVTGRSSRPK